MAFALQLRKKHGKTSVRVRKTSVTVHYTYYRKHPHITKPSHRQTQTRTPRQQPANDIYQQHQLWFRPTICVTVQQPTTRCSETLKSHSSFVIQKPTKDITHGLKTTVKVATLVVRFHQLSRLRMRGHIPPRPHVFEKPQLNCTVCSQLGLPLPAARSQV